MIEHFTHRNLPCACLWKIQANKLKMLHEMQELEDEERNP